MSKTQPIQYSYSRGVCISFDAEGSPGMEEYAKQVRDNTIGCEPPGGPPKRERPEATRSTARPWSETDNRKPYLPTEDESTPALSEGLSFRQSF